MTYGIVDSQPFNRYNATRREFIAYLETIEMQLTDAISEIYWLESLLRNANLQGNEVRVLHAIKKLSVEAVRADSDGFKQVMRKEIAARSGVSEKRVSPILSKLSEHGLISRKHTYGGGKDEMKRELWVSLPQETLQRPGDLQITLQEDESKWGGKRLKLCPSCRSENIEEKHYYVCRDCGCMTHPDKLLIIKDSTLLAEREEYFS